MNKNKIIDISIIIINYKAYEMTANCISSIRMHTKDINYEIILADNSSDPEKLSALSKTFSDLKIIQNNTNLGFAAANNQCINMASGKYILFLNNDTLFLENSLKKIVEFAESLDYNCFIGCKLLNEDLSHQDSITDFENILNIFGENFFLYLLFPKSKLFNRYNNNRLNIDKPLDVDVIKGAFMFCWTEDIKMLNGFDENFFFYSEETDLCYRFKKSGGRVIYFPGTSIVHIGRATAMQYLWFKFKNQSIAKIQFYQKHFKGAKFLISLGIHYLGIIIRIPTYSLFGIIKLSKFNLFKANCYLKTLFVYPPNRFKNKS